MKGYSLPCRSRISWRRNGILSMERVSSRTSQGNGLRSFTPPSLPISVSMNPLGLNFRRKSDFSSGDVSTIKTTSRTTNSSMRSVSRFICCWNAGLAGVSENITTGRATHLKASRLTSDASKIVLGSVCQRLRASLPSLPSVADAAVAARRATEKIVCFNTLNRLMSPLPTNNICRVGGIRRGIKSYCSQFAAPRAWKEKSA